MKPSFALDLRDEQVTLLHRTSRGWQEVGQTRFDAPDMAEALAYMRSTALGLSPRGISTKVILPNDQILFTQVAAPGPDSAKRKKQVRAGLEGLTPYALDDLIYDTHGSGPEVQVAAVARETLEQAEAFASEHRFNPVSFVAVPDNGLYQSEPFFGASKMSPALLSEGEKVERDAEPVHVVPREMPRAPASLVAEDPARDDMTPDAPVPEDVSEAPAEPEIAVPEAEAEPEPLVMPRAPDSAPDSVPEPAWSATFAGAQLAPAAAPVPEAPMALDVPDDDFPTAPPRPMTAADLKKSLAAVPPPDDDVPAGPSEAVRAALAARRGGADTGSAPSLGAAPASGSASGSAARPAAAKPVHGSESGGMKTPPPLQASKPNPQAKSPKAAEAMVTAPAIPGLGRRKAAGAPAPAAVAAAPAAAPAKAATGAKPMTDLKGRPVQMRGRPRYLGLILTGILLVFLVLIAAWSSYFLAGLSSDQAAPATTAVSQAQTPQAQPEAAAPEQTAAAPADQTQAADAGVAAEGAAADITAADEAAADGQDATVAAASEVSAAADAAATDPAATDPAATDPAAASAETTTAEPPPALAPGAAVSAESVASTQTAGDTGSDEIFLAATEPPTTLSDPAALPAAATGDSEPAPSPDPPPFGTVYQFDADGRILPTAAGVVTPDGVLLVAGAPKTLPPDRPAAIAALAPQPVAVAAEAAPGDAGAIADAPSTEAGAQGTASGATPGAISLGLSPAPAPGTTPTTGTASNTASDSAAGPATLPAVTDPAPAPVLAPDPEMKAFRPKSRPASLVPAAAAPAVELAPDPRLAAYRPRARSTSPVLSAMAASTAGLANGAVTAETAASNLAVNTSATPPARPAALAQGVDKAVAAAMTQADVKVAAAAPAASAEAAVGDEPEVTTPMPKIPTSANVAKVATEKNALATSKIALIGVFGTDGSRYAYVRLNNGTLKKVKVGDQLDGGRVVAISASDLRYQKGGKEVVLAMPRES